MREIKFRIWDKQKNQFFDIKNGMVLSIGDTDKFISFSTNQGLYPVPNTGQKDLGWDRWVLQQFTGLKDSLGREIYEGDIVGSPVIFFRKHGLFSPYFEIIFTYGKFRLKHIKSGQTFIDFSESDMVNTLKSTEIEVLGNVFENPELLKQ